MVTRRHSTPDCCHTFTDYFPNNPLPGLITDCIHLYVVTSSVSPYKSLVYSLHFWALFPVFLALFCPVPNLALSLFCPVPSLALSLFCPVCVFWLWTCLLVFYICLLSVLTIAYLSGLVFCLVSAVVFLLLLTMPVWPRSTIKSCVWILQPHCHARL